MKRTAIKALRTARHGHLRRLLNTGKSSNELPLSAAGRLRQAELSRLVHQHGSLKILSSSLYLRSFSLAALVSLFASGVWYYQNDDPGHRLNQTGLSNASTISQRSVSSQIHNTPVSLGTSSIKSTETPTDGTESAEVVREETPQESRRALVVEADQFYTHDIAPDAPLSKQSDNQGKQTLEMLTPEQATQTLRRNEESFLVGRGKGVVRYDLVQIPSNNPIEDDHAEKIMEVPHDVNRATDGSLSNDWMFWGVFDGHRQVPFSIIDYHV